MNKQNKELEYNPFTFPKHNADKFSEYLPTQDGAGFYLNNASTLYKFDEQQGWADLNGCYYDKDGIPSGWISISQDGKQYTKYDQQMQLIKQQVNKYYENEQTGQNNQKKASQGDNGNKQSHKQKHDVISKQEFIKQLPQDNYCQQTSNYQVKDNVEQVHYYKKQDSSQQDQKQDKPAEQQVDNKSKTNDRWEIVEDKSNNKKNHKDNKDKQNRKGWKNNNENKDNKQANDGNQQVKNVDDSYYILDITKVNDNFNLEEYNKAVLQTNNVVKQCRVEVDNKKIVVNNQKDAIKLYLWSKLAGEYNTQLELKL